MNIKRICLSFVAAISFIIAQLSDALIINAGAYDDCDSDYSVNTELKCLSYLITTQSAEYTWANFEGNITTEIVNTIEDVFVMTDNQIIDDWDWFCQTAEKVYDKEYVNVDELSRTLMIETFYDFNEVLELLVCQNSDGGFGLAEGYTSDIIDTKLALKALTDIGETEAMTNAALYISTLQNEDGGFGYQQGLSSNAYLSINVLICKFFVNICIFLFRKFLFLIR